MKPSASICGSLLAWISLMRHLASQIWAWAFWSSLRSLAAASGDSLELSAEASASCLLAAVAGAEGAGGALQARSAAADADARP
eukprot:15320825-Alexandrium_andersonii.AAC.1